MSQQTNDPTWNDPRITAYVFDELPPDQREVFESEMKTNEDLARAVEEARSLTGQLATMFDAESTPSLSSDRVATIINEPVEVRSVDENGRPSSLYLIIAIAASLIAVVGLLPWMMGSQKVATVSQRSADRAEVVAAVDSSSSLSSAEIEDEFRSAEMAQKEIPEATNGLELETIETLGSARELSPGSNDPFFIQGLNDPFGSDSDAEVEKETKFLESMIDMEKSDNSIGNRATSLSPAMDMKSKRTSPQVAGQAFAAPKPAAPSKMNLDSLSFDDAGMGGATSSGKPFVTKEKLSKNRSPMSRSKLLDMPEISASTVPIDPDNFAYPKDEGEASKRRKIAPAFGGSDFGGAADDGQGPGMAGDRFDPITDNDFIRVADHPLSTFSADVDTASYSKVRDFLMRANRLPRPDAVRIEEMINYFDYADAPPTDDAEHPLAARVNVTGCPWNDRHRLARIAVKGKIMQSADRPKCNLVFLLDTSGSMNSKNKLPLLIEGMQMLTKQLRNDDRVAIVVYAGSAGLVLDSTPIKKKKKIRRALENLSAGGSTNGGQGIALAYQTARENFIEGGVNRVILCTDGDFNVGTTGTDSLVRMIEKEAKSDVFLSVLGFGMGNHNDAMLEQISGRGNGNYSFIDNRQEAEKVLVKQAAGTLVTIAKDVKFQVEFKPAKVSSYRLIGYENRILAKEDFNDDKKDAGEIGSGHSVTALYEIVPVGADRGATKPKVDDLKYQPDATKPDATENDAVDISRSEMITVKLRYKLPESDTSTKVEYPVIDDGQAFEDASEDTRFTAAVAGFGMQLRRSKHAGDWELGDVLKVAQSSIGDDEDGLRAEFIKLVKRSKQLKGE